MRVRRLPPLPGQRSRLSPESGCTAYRNGFDQGRDPGRKRRAQRAELRLRAATANTGTLKSATAAMGTGMNTGMCSGKDSRRVTTRAIVELRAVAIRRAVPSTRRTGIRFTAARAGARLRRPDGCVSVRRARRRLSRWPGTRPEGRAEPAWRSIRFGRRDIAPAITIQQPLRIARRIPARIPSRVSTGIPAGLRSPAGYLSRYLVVRFILQCRPPSRQSPETGYHDR